MDFLMTQVWLALLVAFLLGLVLSFFIAPFFGFGSRRDVVEHNVRNKAQR